MRLLQIVIVTLIVAYPDAVLSSKVKKRSKSSKQENGPCGKRYLRLINSKCYYLAGKKMNWYGAQNNCLRKGLNLADLATEEDFNAIIKVLRSRGNMEDYWFGGNDLQTEGRFTYISTGRLVRYYGGQRSIEPTHRANLDDCMEVRLRENGTTVIDDNCLEEQYFVCQENTMKCANPVEDKTGSEYHSHEHLHHFHHDATQNEEKKKTSVESSESDSRPVDESNESENEVVDEETTAQMPGLGEIRGDEFTTPAYPFTPITDQFTTGEDQLHAEAKSAEDTEEETPSATDTAITDSADGDVSGEKSAEESTVHETTEEGKPTAEPGEPAAESGEPAAEPGQPAAETGEPAAESGEPAAETGAPAAEPGEPAAESGEPAAASGEPAAETGEPAAEPGEPAAETTEPAASVEDTKAPDEEAVAARGPKAQAPPTDPRQNDDAAQKVTPKPNV